MPNLKHTIVKRLIGKSSQLSIFAALLLTSAELSALGLGNFVVDSNLDQPLSGTIELRVSPGDDLTSLKAVIASRDEFDNLGVEYSDYVSDIELSLNTDGVPTIYVSSVDEIIKEPFIHFLVKVDWSGGSFLREYTALIDPPVYAAETPKSIAAPRSVGTDQSYQDKLPEDIVVEELDDVEIIDEVIAEEPVIEEPVVSDEYYQPEATQGFAEQISDSESSDFDLSAATDARYGPVENGESLGFIAQGLRQQFPDLSIYQIMQVLFEENKEAFINGNINGLISGSVLNIADINAVREVDLAQSRIFYQQQVNDWDPLYLISGSDSIKVGQNEYEYDSGLSDDDFSSSDTSSDISDNFQVGSSADTDAFVSSAQGDSSQGEVLILREEIADLETSLASSALENQELNERISILEGQLADMNRVMNLGVEDAELASLEATLAEQNNSAVDDASLGLEDSLLDVEDSLTDVDGSLVDVEDSFVDVEDSLITDVEDSLTDAEGSLVDAEGSLTDAEDSLVDVEDSLAAADGSLIADGSLAADGSADIAKDEVESAAPSKVVSFQSKDKSWFDSLKASVIDSGLWRIIAAVVGFLAIGLGLLMYRRRRVDEEFEVSMLSIESNSQSMENSSRTALSTVSASVSVAKGSEVDKETSFLTVYSDSDAVVQADEVDPIAEADVYIAYGRDEQAEEVLLDGVASNPSRGDIKLKLLGLYHKNQNVEKFERLSEELYAERETIDPQEWQQVCEMGKEIAPNNPLYDLSSSDMSTADSISSVDENETSVGDVADTETDGESGDAEVSDLDSVIEVDDADNEVADAAEVEDVLEMDDVVEVDSVTGADVENISDLQIDDAIDDSSLDELTMTVVDDDDDIADSFAEYSIEPEDDSDAIQLVNFDEDRSEMSELDQVAIDVLELQTDSSDTEDLDLLFESGDDDDLEFSPDDETDEILNDVQEVSDLEIDDDYDEARTQYELAKVFVDLGDEDGARKILNDIIDNKDNNDMVIKDSRELLDSII